MNNMRALSAMGASTRPALRTFANKIDDGSNSEVAQAQEYERSLQQKETYLQFSREPTEKNFGDLERGEIPAPL